MRVAVNELLTLTSDSRTLDNHSPLRGSLGNSEGILLFRIKVGALCQKLRSRRWYGCLLTCPPDIAPSELFGFGSSTFISSSHWRVRPDTLLRPTHTHAHRLLSSAIA